jgi:hypothetical protein
MTLLTIVSPDDFANKAIEWIFAIGVVIVIAVGVIRWIGDLLD